MLKAERVKYFHPDLLLFHINNFSNEERLLH